MERRRDLHRGAPTHRICDECPPKNVQTLKPCVFYQAGSFSIRTSFNRLCCYSLICTSSSVFTNILHSNQLWFSIIHFSRGAVGKLFLHFKRYSSSNSDLMSKIDRLRVEQRKKSPTDSHIEETNQDNQFVQKVNLVLEKFN